MRGNGDNARTAAECARFSATAVPNDFRLGVRIDISYTMSMGVRDTCRGGRHDTVWSASGRRSCGDGIFVTAAELSRRKNETKKYAALLRVHFRLGNVVAFTARCRGTVRRRRRSRPIGVVVPAVRCTTRSDCPAGVVHARGARPARPRRIRS